MICTCKLCEQRKARISNRRVPTWIDLINGPVKCWAKILLDSIHREALLVAIDDSNEEAPFGITNGSGGPVAWVPFCLIECSPQEPTQ